MTLSQKILDLQQAIIKSLLSQMNFQSKISKERKIEKDRQNFKLNNQLQKESKGKLGKLYDKKQREQLKQRKNIKRVLKIKQKDKQQ